MRASSLSFIAGLVLTFFAAASGIAGAAEKEPVSGGLLQSPVAAPAAAPALAPATVSAEPVKEDDTSWGLLVRGGYFGLPDFIADELFFQHPAITGTSIGAEIRYYGEGGARGGSSIGIAVDSASAKTDGDWRESESDPVTAAHGEVSMLAVTLTGYWTLFPSWYVHPYFGIGIGVAHVKGFYEDETDFERTDADVWVPVVHIPIGLAVELGKRLQLAVEGRFVDGIAIGGALQVRF